MPGRTAEVIMAAGGAERSQSVRKGLEALTGRAAADDWVLVLDAARACLSTHDLQQLLGRLASHPVGGILATPAADTLKRASVPTGAAVPGSPTAPAQTHAVPAAGSPPTSPGPEIDQTVDRAGLWRALTPQMFRYRALSDALDRALATGRLPTDEAQALEWTGAHPVLVQGSAANIKITSADDLVLAAALLNAREPSA
jgi:2-C-methyl-D-erythritol 4-phosphate cytidylyltransferase